jgi:hypothetical protein
VAGTAALVVQAGIVAKEPIAEKAIPECNIVCMTGDEMKDGLSGYLQTSRSASSSSPAFLWHRVASLRLRSRSISMPTVS